MLGFDRADERRGPRPEGHVMGIFDVFKRHKDDAGGAATALKDRVTGMASGHADKVDQGLDRAGQMIDEKTGNKYSDQINTGAGKAKDMFHEQTGQGADASNPDADTQNLNPAPQSGDQPQPPQG
jgi:hypothetical protein